MTATVKPKAKPTTKPTAKPTVKPKAKPKAKKTGPKPMSKGELYRTIAENTGTDKKVVSVIMDELASLIYAAVVPGGVGKFTLPGVLKVVTKATPARPEREGINRFTGEKAIFKAKPASFKVKIVPVKSLKDAAVPV